MTNRALLLGLLFVVVVQARSQITIIGFRDVSVGSLRLSGLTDPRKISNQTVKELLAQSLFGGCTMSFEMAYSILNVDPGVLSDVNISMTTNAGNSLTVYLDPVVVNFPRGRNTVTVSTRVSDPLSAIDVGVGLLNFGRRMVNVTISYKYTTGDGQVVWDEQRSFY